MSIQHISYFTGIVENSLQLIQLLLSQHLDKKQLDLTMVTEVRLSRY